MLRRLWRFVAPAAAIALFGLSPGARAAPVTLADLISNQGTIVQGDKIFSNFSYAATGDMPDATHVNVVGIGVADGSGVGSDGVNGHNYIGIQFQGAFSDLADSSSNASDALFGYTVSIAPGYSNLISDAHLDSHIDILGSTSGAKGTLKENFNGLLTFNQNYNLSDGLAVKIHDDHVFDVPVTSIVVSKDLNLNAGTTTSAGSLEVSQIDQRFSQIVVPLPATANMGIALLLCLAGAGVWRKVKSSQAVA